MEGGTKSYSDNYSDDEISIDHVVLDVNRAIHAIREDAQRGMSAGAGISERADVAEQNTKEDNGTDSEDDDQIIDIVDLTEVDSSGDDDIHSDADGGQVRSSRKHRRRRSKDERNHGSKLRQKSQSRKRRKK